LSIILLTKIAFWVISQKNLNHARGRNVMGDYKEAVLQEASRILAYILKEELNDLHSQELVGPLTEVAEEFGEK
jgi:hypothetical protein